MKNYNSSREDQSEREMFYEFSNKKKMECERYQDCSWFQQDFLKDLSKSKLSPGEKEESNFSLNDFDLEMQYANDHTIPQVEDYLEVFDDDVFLDGNGKSLDVVNKFSWKSGDDKITFPNDNLNCDSHNAFCGLKKTDSFDSIEYISSNPADIVPITLMECMNNSGSASSGGNKEKCLKKNVSYTTDNYKENESMLSRNIKNENVNVNCVLGEKLDLNLDLPKVNFEQSMGDMKMNSKENNTLSSMPETCPNHNNLNLNQKKSVENNSQMSTESRRNTLKKDGKNSSIQNKPVCDEYSSIAERIKANAKRRVAKNYSVVAEEDGSDKDESEYEYDNDCETNESDSDDDYNTSESGSKRKCYGINKKSKTEDSKNNTEGVKDGSKSSDTYRERRDKNNEASRRSRQNRKNRERHMFKTLEEEERRNVKLRAEADVLEKQVTSLRQLLLQVVLRKADGT
ncbi:conserved hypothetical protein [Pediculus humanus corporis]|uniref:BZIP domain-containing protein n=1 Tax=Pediculus humanus subsp. corporis TaxID=121224 RepID=E0VD38_PEDHC|nr:uncharacterized protein Phum_PHUM105220 [Pediculus humanus corporis]EEB11294.1 conserved hypothetical protein [Pediculus humanus corporis]